MLEKYFGTHTQTSAWQWASAGKTITAFMVGMAQQENYLSIADTTAKYLGNGWTSCNPPEEEKITIRHQLTMTSGLDDAVPDPYCTHDSCLLYKADAGTRWAYHNAPYTLLDSVIENATGATLNAYTTQKLKTPTGMSGLFVTLGYNNVFFSDARSMARFGLLMLNRGNWNGNQLLTDTAYFNQMVNTSQAINPSYGYLWWLNGKSGYRVPGSQLLFPGYLNPHAPADMYVAMGKDGQFLNIVPSKNMVWVRMGNSPDGLPVPFLMNDKIWEYLNQLECNTLNVQETEDFHNAVLIFPNPAREILHIKSDVPVSTIEMLTIYGQLLKSEIGTHKESSIPIYELNPGLYWIKVYLTNGSVWSGKMLKE
jgi:CubicO group peptidase (beta-lactamase class C family)